MKLNLLSFFSFFAIAITVNGQLLRGGDDTTVQEQEQNAKDGEPFVTLHLDDAHLEFFDGGDGILIMGTGTNSEDLTGLSPVEVFEQLSGRTAPAGLVNAQKRIDTNHELDQAIGYNKCEEHLSQVGRGYFTKTTTAIMGKVWPTRGCLGIKNQYKVGNKWFPVTGVKVIHRACAPGEWAMANAYGDRMTYSVEVVEAAGDKYDLQVCWD